MTVQTLEPALLSWTTRRDEKRRRMQLVQPWMKGPCAAKWEAGRGPRNTDRQRRQDRARVRQSETGRLPLTLLGKSRSRQAA